MLKKEDLTPRNIAKYTVSTIISMRAAGIARNGMDNYTRFDGDSRVVLVASNVVGMYVAGMVQPYTDFVVDKTADFIVAKREERKTNKQEKDTPTEE